MSKILITGATGFIGRALTAKLKEQGRDLVSMGSADGDIASAETMNKLAEAGIVHVFHLAGKTFVPDSWENPLSFCHTNVMGMINVLEFCRKKNVPMTYVSAYVYGHPETLPIRECSEIKPSNPYALTKRLAEEACEFYATAYDLKITTIRPFNVYGANQDANFLIPSIIHQALNETSISVKDLQPRRDYVYLEDLVTALLATLDKPSGYSVYNIGSGASLSVQEVIDVIQDVAGTQKKIICDHVIRTNELTDVVADISKAWMELGWHPEHTFRAGIEKIIQSKRKHKNA